MIEELYEKFLNSTGVSTDTRTIKGGELFFALKGENFDGNRFAETAIELGCSCIVVDDTTIQPSSKLFFVPDTLQALQQLAHFHRIRWGGKVLAITGSNGKTTTKELVSAVLAKKYRLISTAGNLNNHIGVPLTLLKIREEELAVIEMGANHPGEIALLCDIAEPNEGIITNIGKAHLEGFGGLEGVERAKGELYDYLVKRDGTALVNISAARLKEMALQRGLNYFSYGLTDEAKLVGEIHRSQEGITGIFKVNNSAYPVKSTLFGEYNFMNILTAAAAGVFYGVDPHDISEAIANYFPQNNRSQIIKGKTNTLILDAYNANPSSMTSALFDFLRLNALKKMVILGEMAELGDSSPSEHENILTMLAESDIHQSILVGESFYAFREEERFPFLFFRKLEECLEYLTGNAPENCVILLKGSRKNGLERATKQLLDC